MKTIAKLALITYLGLTVNLTAAQEVKKVCNVQKDRAGKQVKVCKDVKIHKKLEGTKVPKK